MFNDLRLAGLRLPGRWSAFAIVLMAAACLSLAGCGSGSDGLNGVDGSNGSDGAQGPPGPSGPPGLPGPTVLNLALMTDDAIEDLDVETMITGVAISSPPVVSFSVTANGVGITGIGPLWDDSNRYVRFTITKLVPGTDGNPDSWVAYVRDDGRPDYDTGNLVDNGDGTYFFTFNTDVTTVPDVPYEPGLTHRVAGQIGSRSEPLAPQNLVYDFVPSGAAMSLTRNIATMASCNECHDGLMFHGRRFKVEYCVQCHNPDLADGEGDMSFMIHRIHAAGSFDVLDDAISYEEVTYPQSLANCRKCHDAEDAATPDGDNWKLVPTKMACGGCHEGILEGNHPILDPPNNIACADCHSPEGIEAKHIVENATPNNPSLLDGQVEIVYEMISAAMEEGALVVQFRILADDEPLDLTDLPQDILDGARYPGLLLAWAEAQDDIEEPADFNNLGRRGAQPLSLSLGDFYPIDGESELGTVEFDAMTGILTAIVEDPEALWPEWATMRTVGLQGYLRQWIEDDLGDPLRVSLHAKSVVTTVEGDTARREVVDNDKCANCHEWFEGHGGNRVFNIAICTMCHVPNQSSSGRTIPLDDLDEDLIEALGGDPLTYPEDAQNLKDLIHGIHSSGFRTRAFEHVRGGRQGYYDWSHVTFPAEEGTRNCLLCHKEGTYFLPLGENLLSTTVRTTGAADGMDETIADAELAFRGVPNGTDWINSPTTSSCFYCHTSDDAAAHMSINGGLITLPNGDYFTPRSDIGDGAPESCSVCHGEGKAFDVAVVHAK